MNQILKPRVLWAHTVKHLVKSSKEHGKVVLLEGCSGCKQALPLRYLASSIIVGSSEKPVEQSNELSSDVSLEHCVKLSRQGCNESDKPKSVKHDPAGPVVAAPETKRQVATPKRRRSPEEREWVTPQGLDTGIRIQNTLSKKKEPRSRRFC